MIESDGSEAEILTFDGLPCKTWHSWIFLDLSALLGPTSRWLSRRDLWLDGMCGDSDHRSQCITAALKGTCIAILALDDTFWSLYLICDCVVWLISFLKGSTH